jgi:hypothetical protein
MPRSSSHLRTPPGRGHLVGTPAFQATLADICAHHACQLMNELQVLPLAPSPWQPSTAGGTPTSGQPVTASGPGSAACREQGGRWRVCPFGRGGAGAGGETLDRPGDPPLGHSGLGLNRTGSTKVPAAYLAAAATTPHNHALSSGGLPVI